MESVGRIRLRRAPRMKYKPFLPNCVQSMDKALEYFRRVAKQTDSPLVRAVASDREFIRETMRISFTPYAPSGEGLSPRRFGLKGCRIPWECFVYYPAWSRARPDLRPRSCASLAGATVTC